MGTRAEREIPKSAQSDAASLLLRSGYNHLRYIKPSAKEPEPMYAGKVESATITMLLDLCGVSMDQIENKREFFRASTAFNLQWRANDEVLDEKKYRLDPVTTQDLQQTPVYHKYADAMVTGKMGMRIALESMQKMIPGSDPQSKRRKDQIEGLLHAYTEQVARTANNPAYHVGDTLPFPTALQCKEDITANLGRTGVLLTGLLLDLPEDQRTAEFFGQIGTALQFGDDYLDWRKDWKDHKGRKAETPEPIRPVENLVNATLLENPGEMAACEAILTDDSQRAALWLRELAPRTDDMFMDRFQALMDALPAHPRGEKIKGIVSLTFYKMLPQAHESGWFYKWGKY